MKPSIAIVLCLSAPCCASTIIDIPSANIDDVQMAYNGSDWIALTESQPNHWTADQTPGLNTVKLNLDGAIFQIEPVPNLNDWGLLIDATYHPQAIQIAQGSDQTGYILNPPVWHTPTPEPSTLALLSLLGLKLLRTKEHRYL